MTDSVLSEQLATGPVFVVGAARSGTSWVYDMLVAHPEVAGAFETWMFTRDLGLGTLFHDSHWTRDYPEGYTGPPAGLGQLMSRDEMVADVRALAGRWLARAIGPGNRFLVEKSPPHLHVLSLIAEVFPSARFVHVLRDGRDVVVSIGAAARSWNPAWQRPGRRMVTHYALAWQAEIAVVREASTDLGDRYLEVRYEELRADPRAGYRELLRFCDIPCDDALVEEIVGATDLGRLKTGESTFRRTGDGREWLQRWSVLDARRFARAAGPMLERTGYESDPRWWMRCGLRRRS
jgi:hypothetical protein